MQPLINRNQCANSFGTSSFDVVVTRNAVVAHTRADLLASCVEQDSALRSRLSERKDLGDHYNWYNCSGQNQDEALLGSGVAAELSIHSLPLPLRRASTLTMPPLGSMVQKGVDS